MSIADDRRAQDQAWAEAMARESGVSLAPPAVAAGEAAAKPDATVVAMPNRAGAGLPPLRDGQVHIGEATAGGPVVVDLAKLVDGRMLIQGNSGAGKSMLLRRLFEEAFGKIQQLLIDPDGEFATLAEILDVAVIDDAAIGRVGGRAIAAHLRQHRYSAIVDLSDAGPDQRMTIAAELAEGLIAAPPEHWTPMLVLVDEVQAFAPHYDQGDVDRDTRRRAITAFADLMARGRKRGIAGVIATQRIAETSKAVVAKATNVVVGRTVFDRDLERAGAALGFTAGHAKALRALADGEFLAIGPAIAGPRRVRFRAAPARSRHKGDRPEIVAPPAVAGGEAAAMVAAMPAAEHAGVGEAAPPEARGRRGRGWNPDEDAVVVAGYREGASVRDIADRLEAAGFRRRALSGISARAHELSLASAHAAAAWSDDEDAIVVDGYRRGIVWHEVSAELAERGYSRSRQSIQMRAIHLGLTRDRVNYWTEPEKQIAIFGLSAGKTNREIIADLKAAGYDRGVTAISKFAQKHDFHRGTDPWTADEIALLKERYSTTSVRELSGLLGKTQAAIRARAHQLGLRQRTPWSDAERQILFDAHARGGTLVEAAELIGRPYPNVAAVARRLMLDFRRTRPVEAGTPKSPAARNQGSGTFEPHADGAAAQGGGVSATAAAPPLREDAHG